MVKTKPMEEGQVGLELASSLQAPPTLCYRTNYEHCRPHDARLLVL
jgi:hypothetical protein